MPRSIYSRKQNLKPPKLRYRPGSIIQCSSPLPKRDIAVGDLFCIRIIYRTEENHSEWRYVIESRKDLHNPDTVLSTLCERIQPGTNDCIVEYKPLKDSSNISFTLLPNAYWHGDSWNVSNKDMLNHFKVVSSGSIA